MPFGNTGFGGVGGAGGGTLNWVGEWQETETPYPAHSFAKDGGYAGISLVETSDRLAPVLLGEAVFTLPDDGTGFVTQNDLSVVSSGQTVEFTESGFATILRVRVPTTGPDIKYVVRTVDITEPANPKTVTHTDAIVVEDGWATIATGNALIVKGTKYATYVDAVNSGSSTDFGGGWGYTGADNNTGPASMSNNRNTQHTLIRYDKTDLDATDRTSELLSMGSGSEVLQVQTNDSTRSFKYTVTAPATDMGTYVELVCYLADSGNGGPLVGETVTHSFSVPVPQSTDYDEINDYWIANQPAFGIIEGFLFFDGVEQVGHENDAYGIDFEFQVATVSEEWDLLPFRGGTDTAEDADPGIQPTPSSTPEYYGATISWIAPEFTEPLVGYDLAYKLASDSEFTVVTLGVVLEYKILGLNAGVPYDFKVRSRNQFVTNSYSEVIQETPIAVAAELVLEWNKNGVETSNPINTYPDSSGSANDYTLESDQATAGQMAPIVRGANTLGGSYNCMQSSGNAILYSPDQPVDIPQPYTFIYTFKPFWNDNNQRYLIRGRNGAFVLQMDVNRVWFRVNGGGDVSVNVDMTANDNERIIVGVADGVNSYIRVLENDGGTDVQGAMSSVGNQATEPESLFWDFNKTGGADSSLQFYNCQFFGALLTAGELNGLLDDNKWQHWEVPTLANASQLEGIPGNAIQWLRELQVPVAIGNVSTTNNSNVVIMTLSVPLDVGYACKVLVEAKRTDAVGYFLGEYALLAWNDAGVGNDNGGLSLIKKVESSPSLNASSTPNGGNVDILVSGDPGEDWDWKVAVYYNEIG